MPHVEGRGTRKPVVGEVFVGERVILRIDDKANPAFWLTLALTPREFGELYDRYCDWLNQTEQYAALTDLMCKPD